MGAYVSIPFCATHYGVTLDCSPPNSTDSAIGGITRGSFAADPDIAGIGILAAFTAVTSFALLLSTISVLWWFSKYIFGWKSRLPEHEKSSQEHRFNITDLLETLVLSCSDQQVFTGAAYAITLRYLKGCNISAYHYNIVANMLLLTCATHLGAVTVARNYWRYPLVALLRIVVTVGVYLATGLLLSNQGAVAAGFPTEVPPANATDSLMILSAACFQTDASHLATTIAHSLSGTDALRDALVDSDPGNKIHGWNHYLAMLFFFALTILVEFGRFTQRAIPTLPSFRPPARIVRVLDGVFAVYLLAGMAISWWTVVDSVAYMSRLRGWVHGSGWMQLDGGLNPEDDPTTFGQLVPMLLVVLTVFTFVQIVSERWSARRSARRAVAATDAGRSMGKADNGGPQSLGKDSTSLSNRS